MHSVNEDIQSSTASQVAKKHFAQNLEMMCSIESSIFWNFCSHSRKSDEGTSCVLEQSRERLRGSTEQ